MTPEEHRKLDEEIAKVRGWTRVGRGDQFEAYRWVRMGEKEPEYDCPAYSSDPAWSYELEQALVAKGYRLETKQALNVATATIYESDVRGAPILADAGAPSRLVALAKAVTQLPEGALK